MAKANKLIIDRKPVFRSSRLYYPFVVNPVMTSNRVGVNKNTGATVDEPFETLWEYNYFEVEASSSVSGYEPYKAFQKNQNGDGWRCLLMDGFENWISLSPGYNWRSPNIDERFVITKVEVVNPDNKEYVCKQFEFQGYDGLDWVKLKTCKVLKDDPRYVSVFPIEFPEDHLQGYDKYRLLIQTTNGHEYVGFSCINMYVMLDHDEVTFGQVSIKGRVYPRYIEKLYMENDECDGLIWEKMHDETMILAITSWYPGYYSSTSYHMTAMHPYDKFEIEVQDKGKTVKKEFKNGPFMVANTKIGGDCVFRTKNYVVSRGGSYYYSYQNSYQYTANGREWTKRQGMLPTAFWLGGGGGFGTKNDVGLVFAKEASGYYSPSGPTYAWRLELDGKGVKAEKIGEVGKDGLVDSGGQIGDIVIQGTYLGDHLLQHYKFMNSDGEIYESPLQAEYQYTDMSESDPAKRVKTTSCNWSFCYANGTYYAAGRHNTMYYYNEVKRQWQWLSRFTVLKSKNGFKSYTSEVLDPCPDYRYRSWGWGIIGDGAVIIEQYAELDGNLNPTNIYHTNIDGNPVPDFIDVPMIGMNSDPTYRAIRIAFSNNVNNGGDSRIRVDSFGVSQNHNSAFIKDGKPDNPEFWVIPTAFRKNGWSSNSYDEGGFIFVNRGITDGYAYGTSNYMIDKHNITYPNILS